MRTCVAVLIGLVFLSELAFGVAEEQKLPIVMVTDTKSLGDKGANDSAWEGVKRAANEFGSAIDVIQSKAKDDYATNLAAAAQRAKIVVAVGADLAETTAGVASMHTNVYFVQVGGEIAGRANVVSFDFKTEEAGFLAGLVAAMYTKSGVVGLVAGPKGPSEPYRAGFAAGVKTVAAEGRKIEVASLENDAGAAQDAQSAVEALVSRGCDVIAGASAADSAGLWDVVKDKVGVQVIWADVDADAAEPGRILASTIKRVDVAVFEGIRMAIDKVWESGPKSLGLREDGVNLSAMTYSKQLFTPDALSAIDHAKGLLGRAEITVPARLDLLEGWTPPSLKPQQD